LQEYKPQEVVVTERAFYPREYEEECCRRMQVRSSHSLRACSVLTCCLCIQFSPQYKKAEGDGVSVFSNGFDYIGNQLDFQLWVEEISDIFLTTQKELDKYRVVAEEEMQAFVNKTGVSC
jgi:hypothetical protein